MNKKMGIVLLLTYVYCTNLLCTERVFDAKQQESIECCSKKNDYSVDEPVLISDAYEDESEIDDYEEDEFDFDFEINEDLKNTGDLTLFDKAVIGCRLGWVICVSEPLESLGNGYNNSIKPTLKKYWNRFTVQPGCAQ